MWVRNRYGLWQGNDALLTSCAEHAGRASPWMHPDHASGLIIHGAWQALQAGDDGEAHSIARS